MARALPNNPTEDAINRYQNWKNTTNFQTLIDIIDDSIYCLNVLGLYVYYFTEMRTGQDPRLVQPTCSPMIQTRQL